MRLYFNGEPVDVGADGILVKPIASDKYDALSLEERQSNTLYVLTQPKSNIFAEIYGITDWEDGTTKEIMFLFDDTGLMWDIEKTETMQDIAQRLNRDMGGEGYQIIYDEEEQEIIISRKKDSFVFEYELLLDNVEVTKPASSEQSGTFSLAYKRLILDGNGSDGANTNGNLLYIGAEKPNGLKPGDIWFKEVE